MPDPSVAEIESLAAKIEAWIEAGDFDSALEAYHDQLDGGAVFLRLPAPRLGQRAASAFVSNPERRQRLAEVEPQAETYFLSEVGLYCGNSGDPARAVAWLEEARKFAEAGGDHHNFASIQILLADQHHSLGSLKRASDHLREAYQLTEDLGADDLLAGTLFAQAENDFLRGYVHAFVSTFWFGKEIDSALGYWQTKLACGMGRIGRPDLARQMLEDNLDWCERNDCPADRARTEREIARLELTEGRVSNAENLLSRAEAVFRGAEAMGELAETLVVAGELGLHLGDIDGSLKRTEEAIAISTSCGLRLVQADALLMRGRMRASHRDEPESVLLALADGRNALQIAKACEYAWGEFDALRLVADAHDALAPLEPENAASHKRESTSSSRAANILACGLRISKRKFDLAAAQGALRADAWFGSASEG